MPIWLDLASAMRQALYGGEVVASPDPLRLAQEFEAAFHRPRLNELIASLISDEQHAPGPLHEALLRLPWADVFTTNYDTLLERAAQRVPTRYDPVYVPEDLPLRRAPRIVKLHGSLPSYHPLVITEEDFRTYARDRAPFAALVQAALVEHAFLLIGFSYDDPNFLRWSGWVRDHLGKHAPSIYLAGWLNLPAHRRQLMEQRGVLPIDLSPVLPEDEWIDDDERHRVALAWLLNTLSNGAPPDPLDWPGRGVKEQHRDRLPLPSSVPLPMPPTGSRPAPAPTSPGSSTYRVGDPPPPPNLDQQWPAWRLERASYPGWIVAPTLAMQAAERSILAWTRDVLAGVKDLPPVQALGLLREYGWQHRIACLGLSSEEIELIETALNSVNPVPSRLSLPEARAYPPGVLPEGISWTEVRQDWVALALHVLQFARHNMDRDRFDRWSLHLEVVAVVPDDVARLHNERCRLALAELDRPRALSEVEAWPEGTGVFPFGDTWRATIWAELGRWDLAERTARAALNRIHLAQAASPTVDIALLSAQGWTRQLLAHAEQVLADDRRDYGHTVDYSWQRDLTRFGCNPADILEGLQQDVRGEPAAPRPAERRTRLFDSGRYSESWSLFGGEGYAFEDVKAGQRALIAAEEGAVPISPGGHFSPSLLLTGGASWGRVLIPYHALAVELQAPSPTLLAYLTRVRVGAFDEEEVERLYQLLMRGAESGRDRLANERTSGWMHPASVHLAPLLEGLSRLAFRLDDDRRVTLAELGLGLLEFPAVQSDHRLHREAGELIRRSAQFVRDSRRGDLVARTLDVAIPGVDIEGKGADNWFDFGQIAAFNDFPVGHVPPGLEDRLLRIVEHITGVGREHALWRLTALHKANRVSAESQARLARSLWGPDGALPKDSAGLWMPYLLKLPEIESGQAERMIRTHFLSDPDGVLSSGDLQNLAFVTRWPVPFGEEERGVVWSASEALTLLARIERWLQECEAEVVRDQRFGMISDTTSHAKRYPHVSRALGSAVMNQLHPSDSAAWDRVDATLAALATAGVPIGRPIPFLLRGGRPVEKVAQATRRELASPDRLRFSEASWGISSWVRWAGKNGHAMPPPDLLDEVIYGVSGGRAGNLDAGRALAGMLRDIPGVLDARQIERLAEALGSRLAQVELPTPNDALALPPAAIDTEIDERTLVGARLAAALEVTTERESLPVPAVVDQWRAFAAASPFPEVREVWEGSPDQGGA